MKMKWIPWLRAHQGKKYCPNDEISLRQQCPKEHSPATSSNSCSPSWDAAAKTSFPWACAHLKVGFNDPGGLFHPKPL